MRTFAVVLAIASFLLLDAPSVRAAKLTVAANGVDSGTCGAAKDPCRTITRAIANAGAGDTIVVGPGRYGDVNGDHTLAGTEEETFDVDGCGCVVSLSKPVTLVSRDGAAVTVIDAGETAGPVRISTEGVVFGKKNAGFTLIGTGPGRLMLSITGNENTVAGVIAVNGPISEISIAGSRNVVSACRVIDSRGEGISVSGSDNVVMDTVVSGGASIGLNVGGSRNALRGVLAVGNKTGISLLGSGHSVTASVVVGNDSQGIDALDSDAVITKSSIFDNGTGEDFPNCGLFVEGTSEVTAGSVFWGAPTGPGADPADAVCISAGTADTTPFATKEPKLAPKPLR